jgi:hypothetical protein
VVYEDRIVLRTPYNREFVEAIKQIPSKLRAYQKEGRPLERKLRLHLEQHEEYFASSEELAAVVVGLAEAIESAGGMSDSWIVGLAAPELFEWAMAAALAQFPDLQLFDVRVLPDTKRDPPA